MNEYLRAATAVNGLHWIQHITIAAVLTAYGDSGTNEIIETGVEAAIQLSPLGRHLTGSILFSCTVGAIIGITVGFGYLHYRGTNGENPILSLAGAISFRYPMVGTYMLARECWADKSAANRVAIVSTLVYFSMWGVYFLSRNRVVIA